MKLSSNHLSIFHILDSLSHHSQSTKEARQLQLILLTLFEGATFSEGRITLNHAQVIPVAFITP